MKLKYGLLIFLVATVFLAVALFVKEAPTVDLIFGIIAAVLYLVSLFYLIFYWVEFFDMILIKNKMLVKELEEKIEEQEANLIEKDI